MKKQDNPIPDDLKLLLDDKKPTEPLDNTWFEQLQKYEISEAELVKFLQFRR
jgi:hypothetical protein